jgi:2-polyprenyl-3-methyl-5-hydroxy-6-metoxy-1,4-benzoquinol methylase
MEQAIETEHRACWCANSQLQPFSPEYRICASCKTLVSQAGLSEEQLRVQDDTTDFYGREYWLSHQSDDLGFPGIHERARLDLPERCLYWLRALLAYKRPPGQTLELGSAHGGFVALMQASGFAASGLELSSWVVDFARQTFGVPMLAGPIEEQQIAPRSLDALILNDVLEHLPHPLETMRVCVELLKPDGVLIIQTPCYPSDQSYDQLVDKKALFLEHIYKKANQHLYLFSQEALKQLLEQAGLLSISFEPAIFSYDQFVVASRQPLRRFTDIEIDDALKARPAGRLVLALIDKQREYDNLGARLAASEADRAARLDVIHRLSARLEASEADRAARHDVIHRLSARLEASEADRAARLDAINFLKAQLAVAQREQR